MFIVLALSSSNILDKSQGVAAEDDPAAICKKISAASSRKWQGQGLGNRAYIRMLECQMLRNHREHCTEILGLNTVDAATEM